MKSRILLGIATIILAAGIVGGTTMAWFASHQDVGYVLSAGTLVLGIDSSLEHSINMTGMQPGGDHLTGSVAITNGGTLPLKWRAQICDSAGELSHYLHVAFKLDGVTVYDGPLNAIPTYFAQYGSIKGGLSSADPPQVLTYDFWLPSTVTGGQGQSWSGRLRFEAIQLDNPSWD